VSALAKLFPNATPRPWTGPRGGIKAPDGDFIFDDVVWIRNGMKNLARTSSCPLSDGENVRMVLHAVNTYDARDEALREAGKVLEKIEEEICMARLRILDLVKRTANRSEEIVQAVTYCSLALDVLREKRPAIESALAVKP